MSDGDLTHRAASALRTALAGRPMLRFDAPCLVGPVPRDGRVVERVEGDGRHLEVVWDDTLVLHTQFRLTGGWHVYRHGEPWRRPYQQMGAAIEVEDWVAVCFNALRVETYRIPDRRRHPGMGRSGPDLTAERADLATVVNLLLASRDPSTRVGEVLLDDRVVRGLGNVDRCEVLWACEISPFAPIGSLTEHDAIDLVNTAAARLRSHRRLPVPTMTLVGGQRRHAATPIKVYGRNGQPCVRCASTIECRPMGTHGRMLYWCGGCQRHLHPQPNGGLDATPMDPHPAAQSFLRDLPWRRDSA